MLDLLSQILTYAPIIIIVISIVLLIANQETLRMRGMLRIYRIERLKRKEATEEEVARELLRRELLNLPSIKDPKQADAWIEKTFPKGVTIREACLELMLYKRAQKRGGVLASTPDEEQKIRSKAWNIVQYYANIILTPIGM